MLMLPNIRFHSKWTRFFYPVWVIFLLLLWNVWMYNHTNSANASKKMFQQFCVCPIIFNSSKLSLHRKLIAIGRTFRFILSSLFWKVHGKKICSIILEIGTSTEKRNKLINYFWPVCLSVFLPIFLSVCLSVCPSLVFSLLFLWREGQITFLFSF